VKEPYWLTRPEALALHDLMILQYGGLPGIRDENLFESALAKPKNLFAYARPTMPQLAASYAAGVIKNHPLLDGNKRTGFMLGVGFLERNGYHFAAGEADAVMQALALAAGETTETEYAAWLKLNSKKR